MELSHFIHTLLTQGKVSVQGQVVSFDDMDISETKKLLQEYYVVDVLEMPFTPPLFAEDAALWAAQYFYKAVQLTVSRDLKEDIVKDLLYPFPGAFSPEAIYSADLILHYLPTLFQLAKGLAPADVLVIELKKTAVQWPFSSVGIELNEPINDTNILADTSLKYTYIDRVILQKDRKRITNETIENLVYEVAGKHLPAFWPNYEPIQKLPHAINI